MSFDTWYKRKEKGKIYFSLTTAFSLRPWDKLPRDLTQFLEWPDEAPLTGPVASLASGAPSPISSPAVTAPATTSQATNKRVEGELTIDPVAGHIWDDALATAVAGNDPEPAMEEDDAVEVSECAHLIYA